MSIYDAITRAIRAQLHTEANHVSRPVASAITNPKAAKLAVLEADTDYEQAYREACARRTDSPSSPAPASRAGQ